MPTVAPLGTPLITNTRIVVYLGVKKNVHCIVGVRVPNTFGGSA
jgi:hypothetical protein